MKRRRGEGACSGSTKVLAAAAAAPARRITRKEKSKGKTNNHVTATIICRCLLAGSLHQLSGYSGCSAAHFPNVPTTRDGIDRLPQRRIRTPTRVVSYPANHPLSRHLLEAGAVRRDDSEDGGRIGEDETKIDGVTPFEESIDDIGADGEIPTASPTSPGPTPEPIRIVPILTATTQSHLTKSQQHYLLHTVLNPAIEAWSDVIRLIRVEGNLTLDRSQLYDGISCGPGLDENGTPSALPPEHHFHDFGAVAANNTTMSHGDANSGVGIPNADLVVYVELAFRAHQQSTGTRSDPNNTNVDEKETPTTNSIISVSSTSSHVADTFSKPNQHLGAGNIRGSDALYKEAGFRPFSQQQLSESLKSPTSAERDDSNATLRPANGLVNATHPSLGKLIPSDTPMVSLLENKSPDSGTATKHPRCSPAYLASATHCSTDQYDRPTHGMIHLCIEPDKFFTSKTDDIKHLQLTQLTVMHELGHILGFNIQSLAHFRERDGTPRTARLPISSSAVSDESDQDPWVVGEVPDVNIECTGILNKRNRRRKRATIPLPAETTIKFRTIRGGVRVADVVTPTVQAVVRNHFSCDTLEGAELEGELYHVERLKGSPIITSSKQNGYDTEESEISSAEKNNRQRHLNDLNDNDYGNQQTDDGRDRRDDYDFLDNAAGDQVADISSAEDVQYAETDVGACIEDHWSRRVFKNDLMNPIVTDVPLPRPESFVLSSPETTASLLPSISPLTLAYFSDAGWYDVDFSKASPSSGPWGRGAGCSFVNEKCIMANGKVRAANSAFFCNDPRALLPTSNVESLQAPSLSDFDQRGSMRGSLQSIQKPSNEMEWTGCSDDSFRKASCNLVRYAKSLPEEFSYFSSTPSFLKDVMSPSERQSVGGPDISLDFCPIFTSSVPDAKSGEMEITCSNPKSARYKVKETEEFGSGSRCVTGQVSGQKAALCVPVACVLSDQSLRVKVDGVWTKCQFPGQVLGVWPHDTITCPDRKSTCPTFHCPQDCVGAGGIDGEGNAIDGICNNETGQCMCPSLSQAPSAAPTSGTTEPTSMATFRRSTGSGDDASEFSSNEMLTLIPKEENTGQQDDNEAYDFPRETLVPCQRAYVVNSDNMDRPHWPWMKPPLSDIYVDRAKDLVDTPVDIFTRTFRVFSSMKTGDVIGFLAISVVVVLGAGIGGMGAVKAYKRNVRSRMNQRIGSGSSSSSSWRRQSDRSWRNSYPLSNVEARAPSNLPRAAFIAFPETARFRLNLGSTASLSLASHNNRRRRSADRRLRNSFRTNKDKAVATMLMDLRVNNPAQKRRQRRRDLLLRRQQRRRREIQERVRHLPVRSMARSQTSGESVVRHSDLPPLPGGKGRVVAVVGALFIDDVPEDNAAGSDLFNNSYEHLFNNSYEHVDDASLPDTENSGHITNTTTGGDDTESGGTSRSSVRKSDTCSA